MQIKTKKNPISWGEKRCNRWIVQSEENEFESSKYKVQYFMQNSILEQAKVAEQNYIIQFLKELKLYKKIDPDKVR